MQVAPEVLDIQAKAEAANVPMEDVLKRANVATTTWWRWTEKHYDPRFSTLRKVRAALDAEIATRGLG